MLGLALDMRLVAGGDAGGQRRRGSALERRARRGSPGQPSVVAFNSRLIAFYQALGFEPT
jgi:hypothetical protein